MGVYRKKYSIYIYGFETIYIVSGLNWGSWNVSPLDKGELQ